MAFLILPFLLLLTWLPPPAFGQTKGHGVEVYLSTPPLSETQPGKVLICAFQITNPTARAETFLDELSLPPGWQRIIPPLPFTLRPQERQIKIEAFSIPHNTRAGRYDLTYSVTGQRDYGQRDFAAFSVVVLPVVKIELLVEDQPFSAIAGEGYRVAMRVYNRGNHSQLIRFEIKGSHGFPVVIEPPQVTLEAGESAAVVLSGKTNEALREKTMHSVAVHAVTQDPQKNRVSAGQNVSVEVIPRVSGEPDPYHRLPARAQVTAVAEKGKSGMQVEFAGQGPLDAEKKRTLAFLFRAPNIQGKGAFGLNDEYRIAYEDPLLRFRLGDESYGLSPLTEDSRYGRGVSFDIRPGKVSAGGFYLQTRWTDPAEEVAGSYAGYRLNDRLAFRGHFLSRNRGSSSSLPPLRGSLYSGEARIRPLGEMDLSLEYGFAEGRGERKLRDTAYRIVLADHFGQQGGYSLERVRAGPDYFGYYSDVDLNTGKVIFPIYGRLQGTFSFRTFEGNVTQDPLRGRSPSEWSYSPGLTYRFPWGTDLSLKFEEFNRRDRVSPAQYDLGEKALRLDLGQSFGKLGLQANAEIWRVEERVQRIREAGLSRFNLFVYWEPDDWQKYTFYTSLGHNRYTGSLQKTSTLGASGAWRLKDLLIGLAFQKSSVVSDLDQTQDHVQGTVSYTLPNRHLISARFLWSRAVQESASFLLSYTIPLQIPVGRKKGIGVLKGRILDGESGSPLADVILRTGGVTAVTDRRGDFIFPSLPPGVYFLQVDRASLGAKRVIRRSLPLRLEVRENGETRVDLEAVRGCRIEGVWTIWDSEGPQDPLKEGKGLAEALVEISSESETLRRFTDRQGRFEFTDLKPGKWLLKMDRQALPAQYFFEQDTYSIELKPGEEKEIAGKVMKRQRAIQMIEEGVIKGKK